MKAYNFENDKTVLILDDYEEDEKEDEKSGRKFKK